MATASPTPLLDTVSINRPLNIPGKNLQALLMLPLRIVLWLFSFSFLYSLALPVSLLRALYLRIVRGRPSQILVKGTYPMSTGADGKPINPNHSPGGLNYAAQVLFDKPFDEAKLKAALMSTAGSDHIDASEVELTMMDEVPNPQWPAKGSWYLDYFLPRTLAKENGFLNFAMKNVGKTKKVHWHVFNGEAGAPTVLIYHGSGNGWDGSSNYSA